MNNLVPLEKRFTLIGVCHLFCLGVADFWELRCIVDFTKWVCCGFGGFPNRVERVDAYIWVCQGLLSFLSEAEKSILLNGFAVGWLGFQIRVERLHTLIWVCYGLAGFPFILTCS